KGDTLYGIARAHGLQIAELCRLNGISETVTLEVGRKLFLPASAAARTAKPPEDKLLWPHPGKREALSGRMTGTVITGRSGDRVVSVSSGRVVWVGPYRGFSRVVLIESENGYTYVYGGNEETLVAVGDQVRQGTQIGLLGR